jgi:hypothetical protein
MFAVLVMISLSGYGMRLIKSPDISEPGYGFFASAGNPLRRRFANSSGPFMKEATQY